MKVFVIEQGMLYDGGSVLKVFLDKEKAREFCLNLLEKEKLEYDQEIMRRAARFPSETSEELMTYYVFVDNEKQTMWKTTNYTYMMITCMKVE